MRQSALHPGWSERNGAWVCRFESGLGHTRVTLSGNRAELLLYGSHPKTLALTISRGSLTNRLRHIERLIGVLPATRA